MNCRMTGLLDIIGASVQSVTSGLRDISKGGKGRKMKAKMLWALYSSLVGQDAIDAIFKGVLEGKNNDEIMQGIIEKRVRKEKKLDKERKAKGDPFKEEYEKIFGEDKKEGSS